MNKISRSRLLSLTGGRSLFCLFIDHLGQQDAAITNQLAQIRKVPLEAEITAENLPKLIAYIKVKQLEIKIEVSCLIGFTISFGSISPRRLGASLLVAVVPSKQMGDRNLVAGSLFLKYVTQEKDKRPTFLSSSGLVECQTQSLC